MNLAAPSSFDATRHWTLSAQVSLRDESFGALAYHHLNRRLIFLKSPDLVALVRRLDEFDSADAAIAALIPTGQHARYRTALSSLAASELLDAG